MLLHFLHSKSKSLTRISRQKSGSPAGFGLIELMVSISIMVLISAIVLARHGAFNGAVLLRSQTYEVALQLRELQLSAVSATSIAGNFNTILGVQFDTQTPRTFTNFSDQDGDYYYDANEAYGQPGTLDPRFEIRSITATGDTVSGTGVSIVFERPNFDARFFDVGGEINASSIEIVIGRVGESGVGPEVIRTLEVTSTGQITVQ